MLDGKKCAKMHGLGRGHVPKCIKALPYQIAVRPSLAPSLPPSATDLRTFAPVGGGGLGIPEIAPKPSASLATVTCEGGLPERPPKPNSTGEGGPAPQQGGHVPSPTGIQATPSLSARGSGQRHAREVTLPIRAGRGSARRAPHSAPLAPHLDYCYSLLAVLGCEQISTPPARGVGGGRGQGERRESELLQVWLRPRPPRQCGAAHKSHS